MGLNVKELKNDALIDIKVNKNFYLMVKSLSYYLFQTVKDDKEREESLKKIMSGKYEEMNDFERSFYTTTLILAEIERVAKEQNLYEEKEILEPGDEGYVEPSQK
jgi:hypothetical protein